MSLSPLATVILGNQQFDAHAIDVSVTLETLPGVNRCRVAFPKDTPIEAQLGDSASVQLDGGEGDRTVLTGKVRKIRRDLTLTTVTLADAGTDLSSLRPATTYEQTSAADVANALAGDAGVSVGTVEMNLPLAAYVAHQGRTAAEHIAHLARLAGSLAVVDEQDQLQVLIRPGEQPEVGLLYGREIIDYEMRNSMAPESQRVAIGSGPAGSAHSPDALRHTLDMLPGGAPSPGNSAVWKPAAILRTPDTALTATQAATVGANAEASRFSARCFLLPRLRPGMVLEVQQLSDGLTGGPWTLTRVCHWLRPGMKAQTFIEGRSAGSGQALLGAALSAVGGLL